MPTASHNARNVSLDCDTCETFLWRIWIVAVIIIDLITRSFFLWPKILHPHAKNSLDVSFHMNKNINCKTRQVCNFCNGTMSKLALHIVLYYSIINVIYHKPACERKIENTKQVFNWWMSHVFKTYLQCFFSENFLWQQVPIVCSLWWAGDSDKKKTPQKSTNHLPRTFDSHMPSTRLDKVANNWWSQLERTAKSCPESAWFTLRMSGHPTAKYMVTSGWLAVNVFPDEQQSGKWFQMGMFAKSRSHHKYMAMKYARKHRTQGRGLKGWKDKRRSMNYSSSHFPGGP